MNMVYKRVEIHLSLKDEDRGDKPSKVYEQEDIEMFDTGKGYEIDVTNYDYFYSRN